MFGNILIVLNRKNVIGIQLVRLVVLKICYIWEYFYYKGFFVQVNSFEMINIKMLRVCFKKRGYMKFLFNKRERKMEDKSVRQEKQSIIIKIILLIII